MKFVVFRMEVIVDDSVDINDKDNVAEYLNGKLYDDPEFFGDFDEENIIETREEEDDDQLAEQ